MKSQHRRRMDSKRMGKMEENKFKKEIWIVVITHDWYQDYLNAFSLYEYAEEFALSFIENSQANWEVASDTDPMWMSDDSRFLEIENVEFLK